VSDELELLFLKKKKQKDFCLFHVMGFGEITPMTRSKESFLRRFFSKKRLLPYFFGSVSN